MHYNDVIISAMTSQITSLAIVYSTVYSGADQRKHQSSASLEFVRGIHRWPMNAPHKGQVTRKCVHLMTSSWNKWTKTIQMRTFQEMGMFRCGLGWHCSSLFYGRQFTSWCKSFAFAKYKKQQHQQQQQNKTHIAGIWITYGVEINLSQDFSSHWTPSHGHVIVVFLLYTFKITWSWWYEVKNNKNYEK